MSHEYIAQLDGPQSRIEGRRRILHKGGGGSTATTTPTIPDELKPLANLYTQQATQYAQTPFQAYQGQRFADLNPTQNLGIGMVQQRALGGDPTMNAGAGYLQNMLSSGPMGATANPVGGVTAGVNRGGARPGVNTSTITPGANTLTVRAGTNTSMVTPGTNAYAGANPYLDAAVKRAQSSVVDNFNLMTKPQTETAMRNSGSFGNSGLQQLMQQQQKAAGQQLSDIASGMYMQDYGNQQQLAESDISRRMAAQQFNSGVTDSNLARDFAAQQFNAGLTDANLARSMDAQKFNSGIRDANIARDFQAQQFNTGITDANIARNLQAQQFNAQMGQDWAGRNDAMLNNWRAGNLQAAQLAPTYGNAAYQDASQLLSAGNIQQQAAQNPLDFQYQQFQQAQDYPLKQMSATGGMLGQNMGSTTTQSGGGGK